MVQPALPQDGAGVAHWDVVRSRAVRDDMVLAVEHPLPAERMEQVVEELVPGPVVSGGPGHERVGVAAGQVGGPAHQLRVHAMRQRVAVQRLERTSSC